MEETATLTLTATETPTETPTPTPTFTPTPNYYTTLTTPLGDPARIERTATTADVVVIFLLFAILISIWLMYFENRQRR